MKKQITAVVEIVKTVLGSNFINKKPVLSYISLEDKQKIVDLVFNGFLKEEIALSSRKKRDISAISDVDKKMRKLKQYANIIVNNHLNKCKLLNGGIKHKIADPGSRFGNKDEVVVELKKLRRLELSQECYEAVKEIDLAIAYRKAELRLEAKEKALKEVG